MRSNDKSSVQSHGKGKQWNDSQAQPCAAMRSNHSQEIITCSRKRSGSMITNQQKAPIALKAQLRRSHLSHSFITCLGTQVGRADKEVRQPMAVKTRLSNLVIIYI